jgi:hypothetical protein
MHCCEAFTLSVVDFKMNHDVLTHCAFGTSARLQNSRQHQLSVLSVQTHVSACAAGELIGALFMFLYLDLVGSRYAWSTD